MTSIRYWIGEIILKLTLEGCLIFIPNECTASSGPRSIFGLHCDMLSTEIARCRVKYAASVHTVNLI